MRRRIALSVLVSSAVVGSALVATPAMAAGEPWNTVFTPPASADHNAIPAIDAPDVPWKPGTTSSSTSGSAKSRVASPQVATASVGAPGLGALPYFSFDKTELTLDEVAQVNLGNGNLLLTGNDGVLNGAGLALRNDRFYNGLSSTSGSFGGGWSSSLSQGDVGLKTDSTSATFTGSNGFSAKFTLSGSTYTAPKGFNATLTSDSSSTDKRYTLQYNSSGEKLTFSDQGWITTDTDRNGVGSTYSYDANNRVKTVSTASGRQYTVNWSGNTPSQITSVADSAGRNVQYDTDPSGRLVKVTKPDGNFEQYTYDSTGRVATAEFPSGNNNGDIVFTFGYDTSNRVTTITSAQTSAPATTLSSSTYTYASGTTTVKDGNGNTATYTVDSSGRVTAAKDALGRSKSKTWTANSDVQTTTDALGSGQTAGNVTTYSYDQLNNATGVSYPTGAAASATYAQGTSCPTAGSGNPNLPKCSSDDAGNKNQFTYDTAGNLTGTTSTDKSGSGAVSQSFTYEKSDRSVCGGFAGQKCSATDGRGKKTTYSYDTSGNLTSVTPPVPLGATTYAYDSLGRVTSVTDGNNKTTTFTYNSRDAVQQQTFAGGATFNTSYYQNGLTSMQVDSSTGQTNSSYDGLGRLLSKTGPASGQSEAYTYDKVGNINGFTDANGKVSYGYDAANQLTTITEPGGSCTTGTAAPAASSGCVKLAYDNNGAETSRTFPGGAKVATTRDTSGRATRILATAAGTSTSSVDIAYSYGVGGSTAKADDRLNIQSRTSTKEQGITAGAKTTYTYDSLKRLTKAAEASGSTNTATWSYGYDAAGNRTSQATSGSTITAKSSTYTYNDANQLTAATGDTSTWTYDGAGNSTKSGATGQAYTVDQGRGAVTAIGSSSYTAFGQGNANTLTRSASSTTYANASLGLTSESSSSGTTAYTRDPSGNIVSARSGSTRLYYALDSSGSVEGVFGATGTYTGGYSYTPYGELRSATNNATITANSVRYGGGYWDDSVSLYRFGARYYDPTIGRFTQYDPSGQEKNPYGYASGDPIGNVDITGLYSVGVSGTFCYFACLSIGVSTDSKGHTALTGGLGVGNPGVSGSVSASSGNVGTGLGAEASCSYGPASVGVDNNGNVSGSLGTSVSTGECSAQATGALQIS
jgi:RHS repeat-associated protein